MSRVGSSDAAWARESKAANRGVFVIHGPIEFRGVYDGLSNTIMMAEIATDQDDDDARTLFPDGGLSFDHSEFRDNPSYCLESGILDPDRPQFLTRPLPAGFIATDATPFRRGTNWASHAVSHTVVSTIHAPNKPGCAFQPNGGNAIAPPSSRHPGGCHILMCDGAVVFVTDSIEAGDPRAGMVWLGGTGPQKKGQKSPYGLWGALGTRASKEVIDEKL